MTDMTADSTPLMTERLSLRPPQDADVDAVFKIHSDPLTYRHRPELTMKDRDEAVELTSAWQQDWHQHGIGYFVVLTYGGETIGFTGVRHAVEGDETVLNLYYRFASQAQGKGYATEAASAALEWARDRHPQLPIVAIIDPANTASARLAEILGLRLVPGAGEAGDHEVYRLQG